MVRWEEDHRDKAPFSSHDINGTCHQHELPLLMLDHLAEVLFVGFLHYKVLLPPTELYFLEGSHYVTACTKGWGAMLQILEEAAFT